MAERRKERGILKYGRYEGRDRNMGIWKICGKREEHGHLAEMRKERGIWEYGIEQGRERNMGIWKI